MNLILGDSHSEVFKRWSNCHVIIVPGATVSGLRNPHSHTNARFIFNQAIRDIPHSRVITMLGEVDMGYVLWHRHEKRGIPIKDSFELTFKTYCLWLSSIKSDLLVISAPLPTIAVASLKRNIQAPIWTRTATTIMFNKAVEDFCRAQRIEYLNLDKLVLKDELLDPIYLSHDHHYDKEQFVKLLERNLV